MTACANGRVYGCVRGYGSFWFPLQHLLPKHFSIKSSPRKDFRDSDPMILSYRRASSNCRRHTFSLMWVLRRKSFEEKQSLLVAYHPLLIHPRRLRFSHFHPPSLPPRPRRFHATTTTFRTAISANTNTAYPRETPSSGFQKSRRFDTPRTRPIPRAPSQGSWSASTTTPE